MTDDSGELTEEKVLAKVYRCYSGISLQPIFCNEILPLDDR
jgi:hypothetical protein